MRVKYAKVEQDQLLKASVVRSKLDSRCEIGHCLGQADLAKDPVFGHGMVICCVEQDMGLLFCVLVVCTS